MSFSKRCKRSYAKTPTKFISLAAGSNSSPISRESTKWNDATLATITQNIDALNEKFKSLDTNEMNENENHREIETEDDSLSIAKPSLSEQHTSATNWKEKEESNLTMTNKTSNQAKHCQDEISDKSQISEISATIDERLQQLKHRLAELEQNDALNFANSSNNDINHDNMTNNTNNIYESSFELANDIGNDNENYQYKSMNPFKVFENLKINSNSSNSSVNQSRDELSLYYEYLRQTNRSTSNDDKNYLASQNSASNNNYDYNYNNYNFKHNEKYDVEQTISRLLKKSEKLFKLDKKYQNHNNENIDINDIDNNNNYHSTAAMSMRNNIKNKYDKSDIALSKYNDSANNVTNSLQDEVDATWNRAKWQFEKWHSLNQQFKNRQFFDNINDKNIASVMHKYCSNQDENDNNSAYESNQNENDNNDIVASPSIKSMHHSTMKHLSPKYSTGKHTNNDDDYDIQSPMRINCSNHNVNDNINSENSSVCNDNDNDNDKHGGPNIKKQPSNITIEYLSEKLKMYENKLREIDPSLLEE